MQFPILVTLIALITYQTLSTLVSVARGKYKVVAPATTGNVNFERVYRTHLNYLENLVIFLPLVWIVQTKFNYNFLDNFNTAKFYLSVDTFYVAGSSIFVITCLTWLVSKALFSMAYINDWEFKIKLGFNIAASVCTLILFILGIISLF